MTAIASTQRAVANVRPGFGATLLAEWTKLRSVRSTWIIVGLAIVLSIVASALVAVVIGSTVNDWNDSGDGLDGPLTSSMTGLLFRMILLVVLGVTSVTSEYSSRSIQTAFTVTPNRVRVLAAKALLVAALGLGVGVVTVFGMFLASQAIFGSYGLETASITDTDAVRLLLVYALVQSTVYTMIPFSIAWLMRSTATAITVSFGFLMLPFFLGAVVPTWVQTNVLRYLPDLAANSLAGSTDSSATMYLNPTPAIAVIVIWLVGLLVAATFVVNRRDV